MFMFGFAPFITLQNYNLLSKTLKTEKTRDNLVEGTHIRQTKIEGKVLFFIVEILLFQSLEGFLKAKNES